MTYQEGKPMLYHQDEKKTLYVGDALNTLRHLPDLSADCIVTSPPYFGLRKYGDNGAEMGAEPSPAEFVSALVSVFREARRVLADDGTFWLNLGDSYASGARKTYATHTGKHIGRDARMERQPSELPGKNLIGIPWRVAFALQDDGWILRNDIIWNKPNAMPESVTDRLSNRHEHVFMFSKKPRYWFDLDPIREPTVTKQASSLCHPKGKNPGDVWAISTQPFKGAHFAAMAPRLAMRCVAAGCKPGGTVLDPFSGAGTTGMVAIQTGRKFIGIDLYAENHDIALNTRLSQKGLKK